jgi:pimeloyl-ACP methyl ester carboxylesterase
LARCGSNLSSRPEGVEAYAVDRLADDIRGLIEEPGAESACLVGHDWGGAIAWTAATNHPRGRRSACHPERSASSSSSSWRYRTARGHRARQRDGYLGSDLAEPEPDDVPNLQGVERLPDASHWVHHDEAERVNELLIDFFTPSRGA